MCAAAISNACPVREHWRRLGMTETLTLRSLGAVVAWTAKAVAHSANAIWRYVREGAKQRKGQAHQTASTLRLGLTTPSSCVKYGDSSRAVRSSAAFTVAVSKGILYFARQARKFG